MARVPRAKAIRPSNTVRPTSTHVTSWKSTDSRSPSSTSEDADSDTERQRFRQGWFHSARVRPAGFRGGVTWTLRHRGPSRRPDPLRPRPLWQVERDGYRGCCAGPAAPPPSYGTWWSWCERLLGKTGAAASHAEANALAPPSLDGRVPRGRPRRSWTPSPSPEVLDPFVERHPGR
ncbi:hypothetical protein [Streptomyces mirabilis]|uniref:hypothetical protein n=1 Tax=Streptomyces mirabilis TaxID=68239 RepID=UPI0033185F67